MSEEHNSSSTIIYDKSSAMAVRILWALAVGSYLASSLFAPEFFEHLVVGRWITSQRALPTEYYWTLLASDLAWRPVSWGFALCVSLFESFFGETGLAIYKLSGFLFFVLSATTFYTCQARDGFFGTIIGLLVSCAVLTNATLSPMLFGWGFFLSTLGLVYLYTECKLKPSVALSSIFICGLLFANTHGFSLIVLPILLTHLLFDSNQQPETKKRLLSALSAYTLSQFCTPYLGAQILQVLHAFINQLSLDFYFQLSVSTIYDFPLAFLVLILLLLGVFWSSAPKSLRLAEALLLALFALFALAQSNALPVALILAGYYTCNIWGRSNTGELGQLAEGFMQLRAKLMKLSPFGVLWIALCVLLVNVVNIYRIPSSRSHLPQAEVDYILEHELPFPLLHQREIGPYLVYRFSNERGEPKKKAALTPTALRLAPEIGRYEIALERFASGWQKFFDFIAPQTTLCRKASSLYAVLRSDAKWRLVYENGAVVGGAGPGLALQSKSPVHSSSVQLPENYQWAVFRRVSG